MLPIILLPGPGNGAERDTKGPHGRILLSTKNATSCQVTRNRGSILKTNSGERPTGKTAGCLIPTMWLRKFKHGGRKMSMATCS